MSSRASDRAQKHSKEFLKTWVDNAERERYLVGQSMLETSYSLGDEMDYEDEEESEHKRQGHVGAPADAESSWVDLNMGNYQLVERVSTSSSSEEDQIDNSLTTILLSLQQQKRRRSSNTTATSLTMVNDTVGTNTGSKISTGRRTSARDSALNYSFTIPEMISSKNSSLESSSMSASVSDIDEQEPHKHGHHRDRKGANNYNLSNVLFQITCLSVIVASFSFSLGFLFGAKNFMNKSHSWRSF